MRLISYDGTGHWGLLDVSPAAFPQANLRCFDGMEERDAMAQFVVKDDGVERRYKLTPLQTLQAVIYGSHMGDLEPVFTNAARRSEAVPLKDLLAEAAS